MTPFIIYYKSQQYCCTLLASESQRTSRYWLFWEPGQLKEDLGPFLAFEVKEGRLASARTYPQAHQSLVDCIQKQLEWLLQRNPFATND